MLDAILQMAAQRSMVTIGDVACELSISAELARDLFLELERRGYLKSVNFACDKPCGSCPAREACRFFREPKLWAFTEKGMLASRRLRG